MYEEELPRSQIEMDFTFRSNSKLNVCKTNWRPEFSNVFSRFHFLYVDMVSKVG